MLLCILTQAETTCLRESSCEVCIIEDAMTDHGEGAPMRAAINLMEQYGCSTPVIGTRFGTMLEATVFMNDYSFNQGCQTKISPGGGGKMAAYMCADPMCSWLIKVTREPATASENQSYKVTLLRDAHADTCTSYAKPSQRQICLLPTFAAAVAANKTVPMKHVTRLLQAGGVISVQGRRSIVCRAISVLWSRSESPLNMPPIVPGEIVLVRVRRTTRRVAIGRWLDTYARDQASCGVQAPS